MDFEEIYDSLRAMIDSLPISVEREFETIWMSSAWPPSMSGIDEDQAEASTGTIVYDRAVDLEAETELDPVVHEYQQRIIRAIKEDRNNNLTAAFIQQHY